MDFADVLRKRRMVRRYTDKAVTPSSIDRIVNAGRRGPSAGNSQGTRFVVVTEEALRCGVARCASEERWVSSGKAPWLSSAPAHIVLWVDPNAYRERYASEDKAASSAQDDDGNWPVPWWWVDAGASLMAMLLAAVDEGLSAGFLGAHAFHGLGRLLGVPDSFELVGVITIGHAHPEDEPTGSALRQVRPVADIVHYERWNAS